MISGQARKQRKRLFNAPSHLRQKMMAAPLSKKLRGEYNKRSLSLRVGDKVEITRGDFAKTKGRVSAVDLKNYKIEVDSAKRRKVNGTEVHVAIHPSNVIITEPVMSDPRRVKIIQRTGGKVTVAKPEKETKEEKKEDTAQTGVKCQICNEEVGTQKGLSDHMGKKHKDYTQ